jgi:hypothetical protein
MLSESDDCGHGSPSSCSCYYIRFRVSLPCTLRIMAWLSVSESSPPALSRPAVEPATIPRAVHWSRAEPPGSLQWAAAPAGGRQVHRRCRQAAAARLRAPGCPSQVAHEFRRGRGRES